MSKYTGQTIIIPRSAADIVERFSDLTALQHVVETLPEEERAKIGDVTFERDSITLPASQLGSISFVVEERTPSRIMMSAKGTPVPMSLDVELREVGPASTEAVCGIDIDLPAMLRPMVAPHLKQAVGMLSDAMAKAMA